jgi:hypothetical protein
VIDFACCFCTFGFLCVIFVFFSYSVVNFCCFDVTTYYGLALSNEFDLVYLHFPVYFVRYVTMSGYWVS